MVKKLLLLGFAGVFLGNTSTAFASHDVDAVTINTVSVSGCGTQSLTFTGTAEYSTPVQHFVVTLDGTLLLHDHDEPETWTTGAVTVNLGSHTLTATIYDSAEGDGHEDVEAQDTETFVVPSCESAPESTVSGDSGKADEADCCPGADAPVPSVKSAKTTGTVRGTAVSRLPLKLTWINETFRKVYGRSPTVREWNYWSRRLLTDKMRYDALYGAMQWQKLHGRTIGK